MPEGPPAPCSRRDRGAARPSGATSPSLGWLGLHLPEERGGSGFGLPELVVVVEELGRAVAPGPFVPTVIASAVIDAAGFRRAGSRFVPGLADGSVCRRHGARRPTSPCRGGKATGTAPAVLGGGLAHVLVLPAGDDVIVVETVGGGVTVEVPANLDPDPPHAPA